MKISEKIISLIGMRKSISVSNDLDLEYNNQNQFLLFPMFRLHAQLDENELLTK